MFHEYNDTNDVMQLVLGMLAVSEGVTTNEQFAEFDLHMKFSAKWQILIESTQGQLEGT